MISSVPVSPSSCLIFLDYYNITMLQPLSTIRCKTEQHISQKGNKDKLAQFSGSIHFICIKVQNQ